MFRQEFLKQLAILSLAKVSSLSKIETLISLSQQLVDSGEKMPLMFFGHGDPKNALRENRFTKHLKAVGQSISTQPLAILIISGHYLSKKQSYLKIKPLFKNPYYTVKGATGLADELEMGYNLSLDSNTDLDHGAWIVLKHLFPEKLIPVMEISMPMDQDLSYHWQLAQELKKLRKKGILIIGSGNVVHHLELSMAKAMLFSKKPFDWALEMDAWIKEMLDQQNWQALFNYQTRGRAAQLAINTLDHYLPMLYIISMMDTGEQLVHTYEEVYSAISMRCFRTI